MEKIKFIFICFFILFLTYKTNYCQHVTFYPSASMIKVVGSFNDPIIICSLKSSTFPDTISISPGLNSSLEYRDSLGIWHPIETCYYLVEDSSNQFDYEVHYWRSDSMPYHQQIPFDSSFVITDEIFRIGLHIFSNGLHIATVLQMFSSNIPTSIMMEESKFPVMPNLFPTYPNPFNSVTKISYKLPRSGFVTLTIYDLQGKRVRTIVQEFQTAGLHTVNFDGSQMSSGVYYYQLKVGGDHFKTRRMLLVR